MFNVGDKVLVTGEFDDRQFNCTEAIIYWIGDSEITLYMPEWVDRCIGHGSAYDSWSDSMDVSLDEPSDEYGSWCVHIEWLSNGNIVLADTQEKELGPHWKVIKKIHQMKDRRKAMGYDF